MIPFVHPHSAKFASNYFELGDLTAGPLLLPGIPGTLNASCIRQYRSVDWSCDPIEWQARFYYPVFPGPQRRNLVQFGLA